MSELQTLDISVIVLSLVALVLLIGVFIWIGIIAENNRHGSTLAVAQLFGLISPLHHSKFKIFLCSYNEKTMKLASQYKAQYPYFEPHMLKQSVYLENELILWANYNPEVTQGLSYVGSLACTFEKKIPFYSFDRIITMSGAADCIYFVPEYSRGESFIDITNRHHPNSKIIFEKSCDILGWDKKMLSDPSVRGFYCNYWILKKKWWDLYVQEMCKLVAAWKNSRSMIKLLWKDANYNGKLDENQMISKFTTNFFTYHCFVLERIICLFCAHHKLSLYCPVGNQTPMSSLSQ
jgi:hypothetical protein